MLNYQQKGDVLALTAPSGGVTSGTAVLISDLLVMPMASAAVGETFSGVAVGIFEITKKSADVMAEGDKVFWDDGNDRLTVTSTGNILVGVCTTAAGGGLVLVDCRLDGVAR